MSHTLCISFIIERECNELVESEVYLPKKMWTLFCGRTKIEMLTLFYGRMN